MLHGAYFEKCETHLHGDNLHWGDQNPDGGDQAAQISEDPIDVLLIVEQRKQLFVGLVVVLYVIFKISVHMCCVYYKFSGDFHNHLMIFIFKLLKWKNDS